MKRILFLTPCAVFSLLTMAVAQPIETSTQTARSIRKITICTELQSREPVNEVTEVNSSTQRVYCWMIINAEKIPATVTHVWSVDGKKAAEVPLTIKTQPCRTWSNKRVWPGKWKVEVANDAGEILATRKFTVLK